MSNRSEEANEDRSGAAAGLIRRLPEMLQPLASRGVIKRYRKGVLIIDEGTSGDMLYILLQGSVRAYSEDFNEREITFAIDHAGDYFGEMALDGGVRSASVVALEPTVCAVVTAQSVWQFVEQSPQFAHELIVKLIARSRWTTDRARELALLDSYSRLSRLLESLAGPAGEDGVRPVTEHLTHRAMAGRIGCSREMVSRLMKDLEKGGYVDQQEELIRLLKKLPARW